MAQSRRPVSGIVLLVFGVVLVFIYIAAYLRWTPPLVRPMLIVGLAVASLVGGLIKYRNQDQSDT